MANLEQAIGQHEYRIEQVKAAIVSSATQQLDPMLSPTARVDLLATTERLAEEKGRLESELPQLRQELAVKNQQLAALQP